MARTVNTSRGNLNQSNSIDRSVSHKKAQKAHKRFLPVLGNLLCAFCAFLWLTKFLPFVDPPGFHHTQFRNVQGVELGDDFIAIGGFEVYGHDVHAVVSEFL